MKLTLNIAALVSCLIGATPFALAEELPLTGAAYLIADEAYQAYARGDYALAIRQANEAIRLRPDVARLKTLLHNAEQALHQPAAKSQAPGMAAHSPDTLRINAINNIIALQRKGAYQEALNVANNALTHMPDPQKELYTHKRVLEALMASTAAAHAIEAAGQNNLDTAIMHIRQSIALDPQTAQYHLLYVDYFIRKKAYDAAEKAVSVALTTAFDRAMLHVFQGYLLHRRDQYAQARTHYIAAINDDELDDADIVNIHLITADAALAEGDTALALQALKEMPDDAGNVAERRQFTLLMQDQKTNFRPALTTPALRCIAHQPEPVCSLFASYRPSVLLMRAATEVAQKNQPQLAIDYINTALALADNNRDMLASRDMMYRTLAQQSAEKTYAELVEDDLDMAEASVRQAIAYAPEVMSYHLLLLNTLALKKQYGAAEKAATQAIHIDEEDVAPWVLRGYFKQKQRRYNDAKKDYVHALHMGTLSAADQRELSLYIADASLAAGDIAFTKEILAPLDAHNKNVLWRQNLVTFYQTNKGHYPALPDPVQDCRNTSYGTTCNIRASDNAADAVIAVIDRAIEKKQHTQAIALARQLAASSPQEEKYQYTLALALDAAGQQIQAQQVRSGIPAYTPDMGMVYTASGAQAPQLSLRIFKDIERAGKLTPDNLLSMAYTAINANERMLGATYLRRNIDAVHEGKLKVKPQALFDMRRSVAELERQWGMYAAASYRGNSNVNGWNNQRVASDSIQVATEAYWRPMYFNKDGRYLDFYQRVSTTPYSKSDDSNFSNSMQAATGVRVKPFSSTNIIAAFERQYPLFGSTAPADWLVRLAYSHTKGTDLRVDVPSWYTHQIYAETGYYLQSGIYYDVTESQFGRSYIAWTNNTVLMPHVVVSGDYNSGFGTPLAVGAGVGVNLRHWFREDKYNAPRSYFDLSVQYRQKILGDTRASGLVVRGLFNY